MSKLTPKWFALTIAILLVSSLAFGQTTRGSIAGVVTDAQGAVVTGAKVTATPVAGGEPRSTTTGPNGEYRIEALNPGTYNLDVQAQGFSDTKVQNVIVRTSLVSSNNVQMSIKSASESVVVEANVEQIQTETGELSKSIPQVQIKDLPIPTGNPFSLATTLPGVVSVNSRDDFTNGAGFAVNGLRPRANNFLIDGFDNNDNGIGGQAFQPVNQEAVQEVTVLTNSYAAEFGRGGGSVSNLTFRSGSNAFHGAGWWSYDGSALDALTTEQAASGYTRQPQYTNNTVGFRFGGPVVKNKLFFFGTSQWNRVLGANPFASAIVVPTANGVQALQSLNNSQANLLVSALGNVRAIPDAALNPAQFLDAGIRPGCTNLDVNGHCLIEVANFTRFDSTTSKTREWTARADYSPTSSDNIYVRYTDGYQSTTPDLFANSTALPTIDTQQGGPSRLFGTMWAHTFSPSVINEFRFSAQQINFLFEPTPASAANPNAHLPGITLASDVGLTAWGGFGQAGFPQGRGHRTYQMQDAVSFIRGSHSMKLGADITSLSVNDFIPFNTDGFIIYGAGGDCSPIGLTTCSEIANYLDDFSGSRLNGASLAKSYGNPRITVATIHHAYYFQDSWKVKPNLTLDYGLRYEFQPPDPSNVLPFPAIHRETVLTDPLTTRYEVKADRNNFGPRFGFAYSPRFAQWLFGDNKTVIRGGWGMFYDVFFTNIADNTAASSPNASGGTIAPNGSLSPSGRGQAGALTFVQNFPNTLNGRNGVLAVVDNLRNPQIHQWNLNVQRELPGSMVMEVAYVGTRGERLWLNEDANYFDPATGTRLNPTRGAISFRSNRGDSIYHGLQTNVSRNVGRLSLRGAYTWSRSIDNKSEVFITSEGSSRWSDLTDPRSDRGPSAFHRTHRASLTWVYEFPKFSGHGVLTPILGGWATSGQVAFESGVPQTIYAGGFDLNGDGNAFNDRPMLGNLNVPINYSPACLGNGDCNTGVGLANIDGTGKIYDFWQFGTNLSSSGDFLSAPADQFKYIVDGALFNGGTFNQHATVGRNSFYFPGSQTWNLSAFKRFQMPYHEGHQVEFRADFFNAFNHPNESVNNVNNAGNLGDTTNFLNLASTRGGGRNITLWLKYSF